MFFYYIQIIKKSFILFADSKIIKKNFFRIIMIIIITLNTHNYHRNKEKTNNKQTNERTNA